MLFRVDESVPTAPAATVVLTKIEETFNGPTHLAVVLASIAIIGSVGYWLHMPGSDSEYTRAMKRLQKAQTKQRAAVRSEYKTQGPSATYKKLRARAGGFTRAEASIARAISKQPKVYRRGTKAFRVAKALEFRGVLKSTTYSQGRRMFFPRAR